MDQDTAGEIEVVGLPVLLDAMRESVESIAKGDFTAEQRLAKLDETFSQFGERLDAEIGAVAEHSYQTGAIGNYHEFAKIADDSGDLAKGYNDVGEMASLLRTAEYFVKRLASPYDGNAADDVIAAALADWVAIGGQILMMMVRKATGIAENTAPVMPTVEEVEKLAKMFVEYEQALGKAAAMDAPAQGGNPLDVIENLASAVIMQTAAIREAAGMGGEGGEGMGGADGMEGDDPTAPAAQADNANGGQAKPDAQPAAAGGADGKTDGIPAKPAEEEDDVEKMLRTLGLKKDDVGGVGAETAAVAAAAGKPEDGKGLEDETDEVEAAAKAKAVAADAVADPRGSASQVPTAEEIAKAIMPMMGKVVGVMLQPIAKSLDEVRAEQAKMKKMVPAGRGRPIEKAEDGLNLNKAATPGAPLGEGSTVDLIKAAQQNGRQFGVLSK